jgi:hypothetical protein
MPYLSTHRAMMSLIFSIPLSSTFDHVIVHPYLLNHDIPEVIAITAGGEGSSHEDLPK